MARFTTRVELHEVEGKELTEQVYENLHKALGRRGFTRTITGENDIVYHLPQAEYNRIADVTAKAVRTDAVEAAESVWSDVSVLVTQGVRSWQGLRKVKS